MTNDEKRPKFRSAKASLTHQTPEELFYKLSGRAKSHGYLRGPQQDVLREYAEKHFKSSDVAFELPTGTGKTAVGLLVHARPLETRRAGFRPHTDPPDERGALQ